MKKEYHLATTALEEFWDCSKPLLFLGEWCLKYERRPFWQGLEGSRLGGPFRNAADAHEAYVYIDGLYERMLPRLAEALNQIHGTDFGLRYWRIVVGPWLQTYLSVAYDRYAHLVDALEKYPDLTTTVLSSNSYVVPADTLEFVCGLSEDDFNLQIFSKILGALGYSFPDMDYEVKRNPLYEGLSKKSRLQRWVSKCVEWYGQVASRIHPSFVVLKDSYFPRRAEIQLFLRLFGRVLPVRGLENGQGRCECDLEKRGLIKGFLPVDDSFSTCVSKLLGSDLPTCFLEEYRVTCEEGEKRFPRSAKAIFSANAWYYDESFKCWAAEASENQTLLLGTPHGGNYGALFDMPSMKHESSIVDVYYSWGWEDADAVAKVVPMPSPKLMGIREIGASNAKSDILWVTTKATRYLCEPFILPLQFENYLKWNQRFIEALPGELLSDVLVRAHYQDFDWAVVPRMKEIAPNLRVDTWSVPFVKRMEDSRLYVCDHLSTTFVEALAANKPSVLFWDPEEYRLRPGAEPYFEQLHQCGILHYSPESAVAAIAEAFQDVEAWWNAPARQEAVRQFCRQFCRTDGDAVGIWAKELKRVLSAGKCRNDERECVDD